MAGTLEDMYANLVLEDEEEDGVIIANEELSVKENSFVLIGRFLTEKNINFNAMQNVMASLWRPKEGMEIHDLGDHRFSFVFFHKLDLQKVIEGGPWTFEQSLLLYQVLGDNENPHTVSLNTMDIWMQIYDLPKGLVSEKLLQNIGGFVGTFIKSDPTNINGFRKMFFRIRVALNVEKPIKRRMKIKREGGEWHWVNFKYERLSLFCFVCGILGHTERDCSVVYAHPDKVVEKAYGTWLRAPMKGGKQQNLGAKWLRNTMGMSGTDDRKTESTSVQAENRVVAKFMEIDGKISENYAENEGIWLTNKDLKITENQGEDIGVDLENDRIIMDIKRKRVDDGNQIVADGLGNKMDSTLSVGPKNVQEAGPVIQARLQQ